MTLLKILKGYVNFYYYFNRDMYSKIMFLSFKLAAFSRVAQWVTGFALLALSGHFYPSHCVYRLWNIQCFTLFALETLCVGSSCCCCRPSLHLVFVFSLFMPLFFFPLYCSLSLFLDFFGSPNPMFLFLLLLSPPSLHFVFVSSMLISLSFFLSPLLSLFRFYAFWVFKP